MATVYKVRRGTDVTDVEGFAALVQMAQEGTLGPDDAVFVPASSRWHYARSIRQLREHFPLVEDPPPPSGKVREMPRDAPVAQQEPDDGTEATHVAEGNGTGGDVVPLRRGRWTPDGKGVEVPVFNYEVDLEPPPVAKPLRWIALVSLALAVGGTIYLYRTTALKSREASVEALAKILDSQTPLAIAVATPTPKPGKTPAITDRGTSPTPVAAAVASATPTPFSFPEFDSAAALSKAKTVAVTPVARPEHLGPALKADLIKLAVPVRRVTLVMGKKRLASGNVEFDLLVEYALGEGVTPAARARHYWSIAALIGRRATALKMSLDTVHVRSLKDDKVVSTAVIPAEVAKGVAAGTTSTDALLGLFPDLAKR